MIAKKMQKSAEKSNAISQLSINHYSGFVRRHDNENGAYQCTRTLLISTTMPHPDSLSGIGTSRTTIPGSNDIQVMACSVPGLPRLAMRHHQRSRRCRLRHQGATGLRGPSPPRPQPSAAPSCLHSHCAFTAQKERQLNVAHRLWISEETSRPLTRDSP